MPLYHTKTPHIYKDFTLKSTKTNVINKERKRRVREKYLSTFSSVPEMRKAHSIYRTRGGSTMETIHGLLKSLIDSAHSKLIMRYKIRSFSKELLHNRLITLIVDY